METLRLNSEGDGVLDLQRFLNNFGLELDEDGKFGPQTRAAVMAFQRNRGLDADGVVGNNTWATINEIRGMAGGGNPPAEAVGGAEAAPPEPASPSSASPGRRQQAGGSASQRSRPPGKATPAPADRTRSEAQGGPGGGRLQRLTTAGATDPAIAPIVNGPPVSGEAPTRAEFLAGQPVDALYDSTRFGQPQSFPGMGYGGVPPHATGNSAPSSLGAMLSAGQASNWPPYQPPAPVYESPPGHMGLPPGFANSAVAEGAMLDIFEKALGIGRFAPPAAAAPAADPAASSAGAGAAQNYRDSLARLQEVLNAGAR